MKTKLLTIALIIVIHLFHLTALTACAQAQGNKLTTAKSNAGKEQVGNVLFVTPKNWEKLNNNGQTIFIAPNSDESTVITLLPSEQLYGSLKTWFTNFINKNHSEGKVISGGQIVEGSSDEGYPVYLSELAYQSNDGSISYRFYVAAHPDKQAHIIA
ncbi:MAG: hypothetical protein WAQ98_31730, partial [Blastocatellia bacterium]